MTKTTHRALALSLAVLAAPALADDPDDKMTPQELAADKEVIRQLNLAELRYTTERDARYAAEWDAYRKMHPPVAAGQTEQGASTDPATARRAFEQASGAPGFEGQSVQVAAYQSQLASYQTQQAAFVAAQKDYEARMARWRESVAACNAGDMERCK